MEPLLGTGITGKQSSLQSSFPLRDPRYTTMYTSRGDWCGGRRRWPRIQTAVPFQRSRLVARETTPRSSTRYSSGHLPPSPLSPSPTLPLSLFSLPSPIIYIYIQVSPDEKPYDPTVPFWLNVYVAIHFVILLIIATVMRIIRQASFLCTQITG